MSEFDTKFKLDELQAPEQETVTFATDLKTINAQIARGIEVEQQGGRSFLTNFSANLPGGLNRGVVESLGRQDASLASISGNSSETSERAKATSLRDFYDEVDKAMDETNMSPAELARLTEAASGKSPYMEPAQELRDYLLPLYRLLRTRGYSHYDITR